MGEEGFEAKPGKEMEAEGQEVTVLRVSHA